MKNKEQIEFVKAKLEDLDELANYTWEHRMDCVDWDDIEEEAKDEFREWCKENGIDSEKTERFISEQFDWEGEFSEQIEEACK